MNSKIEYIECIRIRNEKRSVMREVVATEATLDLYIDGELETQFLYSSGYDEFMVYGHLLATGKITGKSNIREFQIDDKECHVSLTNKSTHEQIHVNHQKTVPFIKLLEIRELLLTNQQNHRATRGFHGAIIYELTNNRWFACEDIGRHNAVDKVLGFGLQEDYILTDSVLLLSGRLISNIVTKGISARIPVISSMTVASLEGIKRARENNRTLIGCLSKEGCWLYHEGPMKVKTSIQ